MNTLRKFFSFVIIFSFIGVSTNSIAVESKDPIKLTLHDWTGQLITTNIMAEVLKEAGYTADEINALRAEGVFG